MIDNLLLESLIDYKKIKGYHFKNYIPFPYVDKEMEKILNARYCKISRLKKRFYYLIPRFKNLYFVTFTFDDYFLNLSERTQRDLIKDSLLSFDSRIKIILNVDYGSKTERLHYHGIVATNSDLDLSFFLKLKYPCFSCVEKINFSTCDFTRISKYINKLSNHAIKDSTHKRRIYYNFKGYDDKILHSIYNGSTTQLYTFDKVNLDTLLDKGVVTGNDFFL